VPPTGGVWGKFAILRAIVERGGIELAVVLVLTSLVSYYYYLRVAWYMWFRDTDDGAPGRLAVPRGVGAVLVVAAVAVLLIGIFPEPEGSYCNAGGRFGPHNFHENRRGSFQSDDIVFLTYFNAGLRVYDVREPRHPVEIGRFQPSPPPGQPAIQINDVFVADDGWSISTARPS
jgi:formate hydrogenlyase subunit 3/multisubunit Na+/H+ antiporter MnhD subunit